MAMRSKAIRLSLICSAAVFVIVALITLVAVLVFDRLFLSILYKQLAILPGSTVFESWSAPSVPVYFSVYLFNLTNEAELLKGAAPRLQEVGPFVYRENREKFDIVFSDEIPEDFGFQASNFYHFVPEMSVASRNWAKLHSKLFTAGLLEKRSPFFFLNGPFVTLSPYDAMWNHHPLVIQTINVGLFASQNGTKPVQYKIHTGLDDISKVGSIIEVNGQKKLSVWDHEEANMINGSDGSNAPPGLEIGSTIQFYVNDICRSVVSYAVAKTQAINRPDIELLVFSGTPPDPRDPANDWRERMFCKSGYGCPPKGLLALSPCLAATGENVPLYLSQPYFLGADPRIVQAFDQFPDPIPERHSTWIHIEPETGDMLYA
ncbi:Scavenger receptor class B member 1 [Fasciola gigantica]|uniref:Scavenger receptor class B member 1 n=1 Tax=Fasciola gigantica TaxID=46835 RepID=A0A504YL82_FASGI|nr:Scavenger receptor class B member 1 [Fasciola gigantica]